MRRRRGSTSGSGWRGLPPGLGTLWGVEHRQFTGPQIAIHHEQQQIGPGCLTPGQLLTPQALGARFEDAGGVLQDHGPLKPPQPQAVAVGGGTGGGSHRSSHAPHQLLQQGTDQGGLAHGSTTEDHDPKIAALQLGLHADPLLLQGLPLHRIAHPFKGAVDRIEIAFRRLPTAGGPLQVQRRLTATARTDGFPLAQGLEPGQAHLGEGQSDGGEHEQHQRPDQPARKPVAELPEQLIEGLQHHRDHHQQQQGQRNPEPKALGKH